MLIYLHPHVPLMTQKPIIAKQTPHFACEDCWNEMLLENPDFNFPRNVVGFYPHDWIGKPCIHGSGGSLLVETEEKEMMDWE